MVIVRVMIARMMVIRLRVGGDSPNHVQIKVEESQQQQKTERQFQMTEMTDSADRIAKNGLSAH